MSVTDMLIPSMRRPSDVLLSCNVTTQKMLLPSSTFINLENLHFSYRPTAFEVQRLSYDLKLYLT